MGAIGRTFGRVAADYDRVRPEYPDEAVDWLVEQLELHPGASVIDLGAGTGKLTRKLRTRFDSVAAVEPDEGMRAVHGAAVAGSAESIPLDDASVDAVFAGDAFHWFDPEAARREIVRVLRPGGALGLLFNSWWERERPPLPEPFKAELVELFHRLAPARRAHEDWRATLASWACGPIEVREFFETSPLSGDALVDLMLTASGPASVDPDERQAIAELARPLMRPVYHLETRTTAAWVRPA